MFDWFAYPIAFYKQEASLAFGKNIMGLYFGVEEAF